MYDTEMSHDQCTDPTGGSEGILGGRSLARTHSSIPHPFLHCVWFWGVLCNYVCLLLCSLVVALIVTLNVSFFVGWFMALLLCVFIG